MSLCHRGGATVAVEGDGATGSGCGMAARRYSDRGAFESGRGTEGSSNKRGGSGVVRSGGGLSGRGGRDRGGGYGGCNGRGSKVQALQRGATMAAREDGSGCLAVMKKRRSRLQQRRAWLR
ncbi:hypothetical protein BHM03_00019413 [Ensete ventricosum]|nr:hypothetical protein BHM03_00019413 [Ensete ventricosum]